jgi:hypothetical protein
MKGGIPMEKAFELFVRYAERIERDTRGVRVPSLQIYSDKSGCIRDNRFEYIYLTFCDFDDLLKQLLEEENICGG